MFRTVNKVPDLADSMISLIKPILIELESKAQSKAAKKESKEPNDRAYSEIITLSNYVSMEPPRKAINMLVDLLIFAYQRNQNPHSKDPTLHKIYSALLNSCKFVEEELYDLCTKQKHVMAVYKAQAGNPELIMLKCKKLTNLLINNLQKRLNNDACNVLKIALKDLVPPQHPSQEFRR